MSEEDTFDDEGYSIVKFVDSTGAPINLANEGKGYSLPPKLIALAKAGKLTREMLLDMEYTDLLRFATHPAAAGFVMENLGIRGVPIREKCPKGKPINLFPHQIKTLEWMKGREMMNPGNVYGLKGGIVSLRMGLGKTYLALVHMLMTKKGEFPSLVVASKTVMHEWQTQGVNKFFGRNIKVLYLHKDFIGKKNYENMTRKDIITYDIVITTYDACIQACKVFPYHEQTYEMGDDHTLMKGKIVAIKLRTREQADRPETKGPGILFCTPWERVICDESQRYANPKTKTYKCIMALYGKYKWCLTGTPIRNFDVDIWAQFRFCGYSGVAQTLEWKRTGLAKFREHKLDDAIFTMSYKDANITLPPKSENIILVGLTGFHKTFYEWMMGQVIDTYDEMMRGGCSFACVLVMFLRLRQCAIAPYLTTSQSRRDKTKLTGKAKATALANDAKIKKRFAGSEMFKWLTDKSSDSGMNSCKIREIVRIISLIPKGEKVLVFSMFTSCLDLLADAIKFYIPSYAPDKSGKSENKLIQVDGDTTGQERSDLIDQFRDDPSTTAMLMSYKVGSEGLTLTEATHCICIEPWWTNAVHNQAKARCWRTGQTKPVYIHNVYVQNTIEERVAEICKSKDEMAATFLEGTEKPLGKSVGLDKYTLGRILGIR